MAAGVLVDRLWRPAASTSLQPTFAALTMDSGVESWPSLSPDGTTLLYVSHATGHDDIYRRDVDGRNAINLTAEFSDGSTMPAFSPDGRRIAFRSERQGGGLFVMGATGENPKKVSDEGYNPAWSHDGTRLAFATEATTTPGSRIGTSELWVLNVDSPSQEKRKVSDVDAMQPTWSLDGRHVAVWSSDGGRRLLKVIAVADGSAAPVFPSDPDTTYWNPVWSWDGRWLYFVSNASGSMTVGRVPVDASGHPTGSRETITVPASSAGQISLSQDGQRLVYQAQSGRYSLSRAPVDATRGEADAAASKTIFEGSLNVNYPSVSPDGSTVAFTVGDDMFTIDRDGRHLQQLTRDAARDRGPVWTPDGRIAFYSNLGGRYEIWSMRPDGSDRRVVASAPNHDDWIYPKFAGDGRLSVVSTGKNPALLDASTSPATLAETFPAMDGGDLFWPYAWSPDLSRLAGLAQSNTKGLMRDVILYDPVKHRYVDRIAGVGTPVAWLDGMRLIVAADDRYYVLDVTTRKRAPKPVGPWPTFSFSWSATLADGGRTFYFASATTDADIWMMTLGPAPQPRVK